MTAAKAKNMLLEEERKREKPKNPEEEEAQKNIAFATQNAMANAAVARKPPCKTCDRIHGPICWTERPDLAPEWFQEKKTDTKRKRNDDDQQDQSRALMAVSRCF